VQRHVAVEVERSGDAAPGARSPPRDLRDGRADDIDNRAWKRDEMLKEPTIGKLQAMRLGAMAAAWLEQQQSADTVALSFDERFAMLVDSEWMARENKRLKRALSEAKLRIAEATVEGIDYPPRRELDRAFIRQLGSGKWIEEHQVVLISGATGTGKTYVACALAQQACRKGYRAVYRRASRLFDELRLARADGSYPRVLARLARVDVLVIDDFAIAPVSESERRDLLEVLEDRYATRATVIASQLAPDRWHDYLADPTVADAICDRVLHGAHRIALKGPSRRKEGKGA
jgi:DNA replication protein DnaC